MKIYILHGWTYSTEKWSPFMDLLKSKADVELLKIPGLTEKIDEVWNLDSYVDWLKKKVGEEKVVLVGHSNGGRISLAFSHKYPNNVSKLILIDSAGIYHNELPLRVKRLIFKTIAKVGKKITNSETLRKALYKLSREEDYMNTTPIVRQTMTNLITTDITSQLEFIKTPTLIIWGKDDKITPLSDGKLMHQLIKGSVLKVIDARHSPQFTHPKEVVKEICEFI